MNAAPQGFRSKITSPRNRPHGLWLMLALTALLGLGWLWLDEQSQSPSAAERLPPELREEPDLFVHDAVIHQFHPDGKRKYLLHATTINHFDRDALTRMQQPDLLLESQQDPWRATSDYGSVRKQTAPDGTLEEVVFLRQSVELSQTRKPPRYLSMRTSSLYLYPDREYVETDQSVTIDTHTGRTKASSMKGNLGTGVLLLAGDTKQVQTIVLPFQFK